MFSVFFLSLFFCINEVTFLPHPVFAGVSCVGESGESANMTQCLRWAGPLPPQFRECRVACKDDCTLTAWSKYSECTGCGTSTSRRRSLTGNGSTLIHTNITQGDGFIFGLSSCVSLRSRIDWKGLIFRIVATAAHSSSAEMPPCLGKT